MFSHQVLHKMLDVNKIEVFGLNIKDDISFGNDLEKLRSRKANNHSHSGYRPVLT